MSHKSMYIILYSRLNAYNIPLYIYIYIITTIVIIYYDATHQLYENNRRKKMFHTTRERCLTFLYTHTHTSRIGYIIIIFKLDTDRRYETCTLCVQYVPHDSLFTCNLLYSYMKFRYSLNRLFFAFDKIDNIYFYNI